MEIHPVTGFMQERLRERSKSKALRELQVNTSRIDFCSNDYLGFSRSPVLKQLISNELKRYPDYPNGSTGSRLISGNDRYTEQLEQEIAGLHEAQSGLLFNSGYDANIGLFSAILQRGDTVITDELIHASIIDGIRLSHANRFTFRHNDLTHLEDKLKAAKGNIFIAVESIYSMDGDEAPLLEIAQLAEKYQAALIVDEAHATGILGPNSCGLVQQYGLSKRIFARVVTFGKAMGVHGAIVLGSDVLKSYLINFARSFIYTTAAPFYTHAAIKAAYRLLREENLQDVLQQKIRLFKENIRANISLIPSRSAIQSIIIGGNAQTRHTALRLQEAGFDVRAILHPTVPEGKERLRICLHLFNSDTEIISLTQAINELI
ncbi:8-amino-7-oxononanoate synthase [Pedobacter sp. BS3]|uniref:aminotransferase class I/II-fold pyridoxal phosphate-dependent enzyme n=1 Tax=Pedobacter sp. BS3 TaxID=2567937 RepID=UPI0011ED8B2C|nr:8-amino-7-oxononanoate synthase [Pedobacter sp. BS3]TZF84481.1 8-amino-7-oxononanoate synthase [Pedobacter sp. BS3]